METVGQMTAISENIPLIPLNLCPPQCLLDCQVSHVVSNNAGPHPASPVKTTNKLKLTKSPLSFLNKIKTIFASNTKL